MREGAASEVGHTGRADVGGGNCTRYDGSRPDSVAAPQLVPLPSLPRDLTPTPAAAAAAAADVRQINLYRDRSLR
jgi:hypothetical protein